MSDDFDKFIEGMNRPLDLVEREFEMLRNIYYGLQPLAPAARQRVVSHVMGMLASQDQPDSVTGVLPLDDKTLENSLNVC